MELKPLHRWQGPLRAFGAGFHLLAVLGLAVSIYYVHAMATLRLQGLATRFAGPETDQVSPHSFLSLLQTTHTHLYTLAFLQLALGGFFLLGSAPERLKRWVAGGLFGVIALDHAAMWAAFKFGPAFSILILLCGTLMTLGFAVEIGWNLKDLGFRKR